ncbi:MAG: 50S ribosomal protein L13 [Candidatus Saccharibacteria bacterium]|jgi:large subunit ribosomal protein L13|nr:50S ribosomal protein L13 [Patescibacteria group bacterium]
MKTYSAKPTDVEHKWYLIDAKGMNLGRLSTKIAQLLMGKHKPAYTPNVITGDIVVVINCAKIKVTGNKLTDKFYYKHSGYPGGLKETSLKEMLEKHPNRVIEHSVAGMLPKNKLRDKMLLNLKVYPTTDHKHEAQKPELIKVEA